ncbi:MAG: pilin, partial [Psychrobacter sp.]
YIARSQAARVMNETATLKNALEDCINNGRTETILHVGTPTAGDEATTCVLGTNPSNLLGADVAQVDATTEVANDGLALVEYVDGGTATVTATFAQSAASRLKLPGEDTMTWDRSAEGTWTCTATIPGEYRPTGCSETTE